MTRIFSDAFPSWPHRSGAFTCRTTRSWVRNASIAASAFAIMSVSRPPVAPRTSMTSMPKVRNIPRISATPAIPAAVRWNRSVIGTRSGKMPAPRSTIAFAGGSPFATRARFTGWALRILYDCCVKALTAFAVTLAADSRGFDSWIVFRIVPEEGEVARVAARRDAGGDGVDEPIHAVRREPVQVWLGRSLEGRLVAELGERSVPQAVENHEEDLARIHFGRRRSGP